MSNIIYKPLGGLNLPFSSHRNLKIRGQAPYLELKNTTHEDTNEGRESQIRFRGEQSGGELSTLAKIQASHDGTSDDEKGDLIFYTNDGSDGDSPTERMRIDSSGNVGIGTVASYGKLGVINDAFPVASFERQEAGNAYWSTLAMIAKKTDAGSPTDSFGINMYVGYRDSNGALNKWGQLGVKRDGDDTKGRFVFTPFDGADDIDALIIESDGDILMNEGNVGIGTTTPSEKLEVFNSTADNLNARVYSSGGGASGLKLKTSASDYAVYASAASDRLTFRDLTDSLDIMTLDGDGNVGIGETAPETLLELSSTAPYITLHNSTEEDGDGGRESKLLFKGEQSGGEETTLAAIQASHDGTSDDEKGDLIFYTNDGSDGDAPTERMRIDSNGNVGIGAAPDVRLNVTAATGQKATVKCTNISGHIWHFGVWTSVDSFSFARTGVADVFLINNTVRLIQFNPSSYDWDFRVNSDDTAKFFYLEGSTGRMGFGTTQPETTFEIIDTAPYITLHNSTEEDGDGGRESQILFKGEQSGGEETTLAKIQASHDGAADDQKGDLIFYTNDGTDDDAPTERMRIDSSGYIGIGTSAPITEFQIAGTTTSTKINLGGGLTAFILNGVSLDAVVGATSQIATELQYIGIQHSDVALAGARFMYARSRGTLATPLIVQDGDSVAALDGAAFDGTDYVLLAQIDYEVDGTPGANDMPGRIVFKTTADGGILPTERMRIDSAGNVTHEGIVTLPKASGNGIKVDTTTPTFGWRDILGQIRTRGVGATDPNDATYIGTIKGYEFAVNDEAWIVYHIPHDYAIGTDIYLHFHWSHNSAIVTGGNVTWEADITYAKGHNQAAFAATVNPTITPDASTTQYQHMVSEVQISASSPGATQIDSDNIEPDGIILARVYLTANNITSSGAVPDPFLHEVDVHYQSTNISTKAKVPDFYA